jgi:hypothetical protein
MQAHEDEEAKNIVLAMERNVISCTDEREEHVKLGSAAAKKLRKIKDQIRAIYQEHNQDKLAELDSLWEKYKGKEEDLLKAVKKKDLRIENSLPSGDFQWQFTLIDFSREQGRNRQMTTWYNDETLETIMPLLEERAESIGGKCKFMVHKSERLLVVHRDPEVALRDKGVVESTVKGMKELIGRRHRYDARPTDYANEHDRRKADKERDQARKSRQKKPQYKRK